VTGARAMIPWILEAWLAFRRAFATDRASPPPADVPIVNTWSGLAPRLSKFSYAF